ncbi:Signal-transduction histidine kinase senX3 [Planctomycetes bacterium CA13]|uniref:histidine kinase n=2 Tax=Novipirellula herctigrandis TaxID=2527986 RepID=A0A5C5YP92_9BACT|nr:Signal-transduction histidine kinase senX3 [Planctomycetes bacterium CA13]
MLALISLPAALAILTMLWIGTWWMAVFVTIVTVACIWTAKRLDQKQAVSAEEVFQNCVSETRQHELALTSLRTSAEQATMALTKMRDGVIMLSPTREILVINPWSRRLLGLSTEGDLRGRLFREVVRIPELVNAVEVAVGGQTPQKLLLEIVDGVTTRPVKARVDRITTDKDSNLLMTLRDETEAQQIESMRREFIANLSHEIKTPLAAIKGYAETVELAIEDDPAAATHFMAQIRGQCVRLERLVADMMQLARAQSGRENLQLKTVSLAEIVDESLLSYRPVAEANQITISLDEHLDPSDRDRTSEPNVVADHEAVLTIVNNLVGNAIRYTPQGGDVRLACRRRLDKWVLIVADTGMGMTESEQRRVFERFYRGEKTRKLAAGGTGIGLSIVKNLTKALRGEVRLESEPGKGSTFEISLPAAD